MGKRTTKLSNAVMSRTSQLGPQGTLLVIFAGDYMRYFIDSGASVDSAIRNTMILWNLALVSDEDRQLYIDKLRLEWENAQLDEKIMQEFLKANKLLTERHRQMYPEMHEVTEESDPTLYLFDPEELNNLPPLNAKVWRNQACTCGSGLKYKKCCGKVQGGSRTTPDMDE